MYYNSIEEAISAAPNCTHVMKKSESKGNILFVSFAPVILTDGKYLCATYTSMHDGTCMSEDAWVIALDRNRCGLRKLRKL